MRVRIESDGGPRGTKVIDLATGQDITDGIYYLEWIHSVNDGPNLIIGMRARVAGIQAAIDVDVEAFEVAYPDDQRRVYRRCNDVLNLAELSAQTAKTTGGEDDGADQQADPA